jgi:hypothetical protein
MRYRHTQDSNDHSLSWPLNLSTRGFALGGPTARLSRVQELASQGSGLSTLTMLPYLNPSTAPGAALPPAAPQLCHSLHHSFCRHHKCRLCRVSQYYAMTANWPQMDCIFRRCDTTACSARTLCACRTASDGAHSECHGRANVNAHERVRGVSRCVSATH